MYPKKLTVFKNHLLELRVGDELRNVDDSSAAHGWDSSLKRKEINEKLIHTTGA